MDKKGYLIIQIRKTLNALLQVLDELQASETQLVKHWLDILRGDATEEQINEIWKQIQDAGTHMGFMDYADPQYDDLMWRLQQQMLTLVELIRRNS